MGKKNSKQSDGGTSKSSKTGSVSANRTTEQPQKDVVPPPGNALGQFIEELKARLENLVDYTTTIQELPTQLDLLEEQYDECQRVLATNQEQADLLVQKDKQIEEWKDTVLKVKDIFKEDLENCRLNIDHSQKERDEALKQVAALRDAIENLKQEHIKETEDIEDTLNARMHAQSVQDAEAASRAQEHFRKEITDREAQIERLKAELEKERHISSRLKLHQEGLEMDKKALSTELHESREILKEERRRTQSLVYKIPDERLRDGFTGIWTNIHQFVTTHLDTSGHHPHEPEQLPFHRSMSSVIPFSYSTTSKSLRTIWIMSRISHALDCYFFRPFSSYLGSKDQADNMRWIEWCKSLSASDVGQINLEAVWRNLTLQAMSNCGEFGQHLMEKHPKTTRDMEREHLLNDELERIWPVLNADASRKNTIQQGLYELVGRALMVWVSGRRNIEKVEADREFEWSPLSDWDHHFPASRNSSVDRSHEDGIVLIDDTAIDTASTVSTYDDDASSRIGESRKLVLSIFPRFSRPVQVGGLHSGRNITLSEGVGLFEGSPLIAQGEKEVNEIRLRELQEKHHHHRRISGTGKLRRVSGVGISSAQSTRTHRRVSRTDAAIHSEIVTESMAILQTLDLNNHSSEVGAAANGHGSVKLDDDSNPPTPKASSPIKVLSPQSASTRRVSVSSSSASVPPLVLKAPIFEAGNVDASGYEENGTGGV